jgi:metal-responsive CopG/Arc/MetJ family transcriptional regulator
MPGNTLKLSISLPADLVSVVDSEAEAQKTTRSGFIASLLRELAERREHDLMVEGYKVMAETNQQLAEQSLAPAGEVWPT